MFQALCFWEASTTFEDETNPDWLPSLLLGHSSISDAQVQSTGERWARKKARDDARATAEAAQALLILTDSTYASDQATEDTSATQATQDVSTQTDISSGLVHGHLTNTTIL